MNRNPDIIFMTEYIENVLYFATMKQRRVPQNAPNVHYFCIDDDLIYENYYSDFGPLNLGCVYKYCNILHDKIKSYLNKQTIIHYTSTDPRRKANAAYLMGCYGVLYLTLPPSQAFKPLVAHGQCYLPFQDASPGKSHYTITILDCLQALAKARDLGFFNFQDFNLEEYIRLDKIQGGDLNWIVPGKFLAFIGPVDRSYSLYHPPEMYIDYFLENNVKIVIRLNKKMYDNKVFLDNGITHYDLFFPDGSCPQRHILIKFLQICEDSNDAIAVHCKAGLGRTGTLIGCFLIKHYRMTAHEAIAWMRICRSGSVIGHQQEWLEQLEAWLIKQGNLYRKILYQDVNKLPKHEFGIYSIAEKAHRQKPVVLSKSVSPPPPIRRQTRPEMSTQPRPQASKTREDISESEEDETFITCCDLTIDSTEPVASIKGCVIKDYVVLEESHDRCKEEKLTWKEYICCRPCLRACTEVFWNLAVRCTRWVPIRFETKFCVFFYTTAFHKTVEREKFELLLKKITNDNNSIICVNQISNNDASDKVSRNKIDSSAGESHIPRVASRSRAKTAHPVDRMKNSTHEPINNNIGMSSHRSTFGPIAKHLDEVKDMLLQNRRISLMKESQLKASVKVSTQHSFRGSNVETNQLASKSYQQTTNDFGKGYKESIPLHNRRRLGRSPSPPITRIFSEQSRATNTPTQPRSTISKESKAGIKAELSKLKLPSKRNGSVGAASLGARRDAPAERRAPSVRSDERPLATQGDLLNSIKYQRILRESIATDLRSKIINMNSTTLKENTSSGTVKTPRTAKSKLNQESSKEKFNPTRGFSKSPRPSSPLARKPVYPSFY